MLVDSAGWHTANELRVLPNIPLLHLPPCACEPNAIDLPGRMFVGMRAIADARCSTWNGRLAEIGRIYAFTDFGRARPADR